MLDKLKGIENRYTELEKILSNPEIFKDQNAYRKYSREHSDLGKIVTVFKKYQKTLAGIQESQELLKDSDTDIRDMAKDEIDALTLQRNNFEKKIKELLIPKDPSDDKNAIIEIRAGTGGEEAGLFAGDLFRMYSKYAEDKRWQIEIMTHHSTGVGGFKEVIAMVHGNGAYSCLKYESGIHRVQRVPVTEAQGRVHTSAVTVAVLPEAEEVDLQIDPNEIKVDVYRSSGPGGQSVNTTDSAVRITHLPTGVVVTCQDEKSQLKNKTKAMKVLRARLLDAKRHEQNEKRSEDRKNQIGSGDRSGRIRTYNFPQGRVTDHRISLTLYKLDQILGGEADLIITPLKTHYRAEALQHGEAA